MKSVHDISTTIFTPSNDQCSADACEETTQCCGDKQRVNKACMEDNSQIVGVRLTSSSSDPISKGKASGSECTSALRGGANFITITVMAHVKCMGKFFNFYGAPRYIWMCEKLQGLERVCRGRAN
ncbi:unnamed protein product [Albugo candida]|uniref:Uncharacterized protein n=1 Tax=Albugo candida TaxID=65357 RepID=A0A024FTC1_9STRA|nr:unnamed protein product [Albugo candida]|eukprot:CCI10256.1 unnamed protein product [Albugo candida]